MNTPDRFVVLKINAEQVIYKVFGTETENYVIEKGDMVFLPKGLAHKVIALSPRITASVGFHGRRINV